MKKKLTSLVGIALGLQLSQNVLATDIAMLKVSDIKALPASLSVSHDPAAFNRRLKNPQFACNIAKLFANGQGVKRDDTVAYKLYRYAAEQGNAEAQYQLGLFLADERGGINVADGPDLAIFWLQKAMEQGHKGAKFSYNFLMNNTWYEGC